LHCDPANTWSAHGDGGGGSSEWTDTTNTLHPNETADEVVLGATSPVLSGKLSIDGDADQRQLVVQGFSTQTNDLVLFETSAGADLFKLDNAGTMTLAAVGAPAIELWDSDAVTDDTNFQILVNLTDTGTTSEDADATFYQHVNNVLTAFMTADADGNLTLGTSAQPVKISGELGGYRDEASFNVEGAATGDDGNFQHKFTKAVTLDRISCSTTANAADIQFYERAENSPNTGTTSMLTSNLTCNSDTTADATTAFADSAVAADSVIALGIKTSTLGSTDILRVFVEVVVD
jgi:hypothetical protein